MQNLWTAAVAALVLCGAPAAAADKADLKVLYVGSVGSLRGKDFKAFLDQHFTKVTPVELDKFREADADGHDVVIFDWASIYPRGKDGEIDYDRRIDGRGYAMPPAPKLSREYDRPTILVGAAGGKVAEPLQLKIDWYCLCLENAAHGLVSTHAVFHKPHKVEVAYEDLPTPEHYRRWPGGERLGKTIKVWKVQTKGFPDIDPGLVSDPYGFADSPDAEVISAGLNHKGPDSVALGRHGNFFLWGFAAQPSDMSLGARTCFVNVVHYIKRFDGRKPLVRKTAQGRQWAFVYAGYVKWTPEERLITQFLPEDLYKRFGKDSGKYAAYYRENLEYLHPAGNYLVVDEDVSGLGLSNRQVDLLDRCVGLLEKGEQTELALRVLKRYTTEALTEPRQWRAWLDTSRHRLFFTDTGGYRFVAEPER